MFDIGWTELLVIGIVALIVVGPKDLPKMFRTLGQMTAKARGMAREFQRAMDDAADASGVKDVARDLRKATDIKGTGLDELNKMRNWDPLKDDKAGAPTSKSTAKDAEAEFDDLEARMDRADGPPKPDDVPKAAQSVGESAKAATAKAATATAKDKGTA